MKINIYFNTISNHAVFALILSIYIKIASGRFNSKVWNCAMIIINVYYILPSFHTVT